MAEVRVWNPTSRKQKKLSREQVADRQAKAVHFLHDVAGDPDLADEIDDLSVEEYAQRKGFELVKNPTKRRKEKPMKKDELKQAVKDGLVEALKESRRSNPNGQGQSPTNGQVAGPSNGETSGWDRDKVLDAVDDAAAALADGDEDEALDILNGLLDRYDDAC